MCMKRHYTGLINLIAALTIFTACSDAPIAEKVDMGYDFFPMHVNSEFFFNVTNITIDVAAGVNDTSVYKEKNVVVDSIIKENSTIFIVNSYLKNMKDSNWSSSSVYHVRVTEEEVVSVVNNTQYKLLKFPISANTEWDYNYYNTEFDEEMTISDLYSSQMVESLSYDSCLIAHTKDFVSLYSRTFIEYLYAKNVGMLRYKLVNVESQSFDDYLVNINLPIMDRITKGQIIVKTIADPE